MISSERQRIVLASGNVGKIKEIQAIFKSHEVIAQNHFHVPEADETGKTFVENAIIKARNAAQYSQLPAIADDSGLQVDALGSAPGVISARYSGKGATDEKNLHKVLDELAETPEELRTARFICVMVFMKNAQDPCPVIAEGVWEGSILRQPVGEYGFGYDPIFWVPEFQCASAQLSAETKNAVSHRAKALQQLTNLLQQ